MRCLSIADACKEMGHEITFIVADDQCSDLIHQRGYDFVNLFGKWNDLEYELCELENLVRTCAISILISPIRITNRSKDHHSSVILTCVKDSLLQAFNKFH